MLVTSTIVPGSNDSIRVIRHTSGGAFSVEIKQGTGRWVHIPAWDTVDAFQAASTKVGIGAADVAGRFRSLKVYA